MLTTKVVTSPFIDSNSQLFYEASYNQGSKKLSLKIFNHRGVLKNKRTIQVQEPIADLFTAEEYLIGLNHNHHQIYIFDVRKHLKSMAVGQLNVHSGMGQKMRKNNQKFTSFFYNREQPLIYGLFDEKHVFYFRLNKFTSGQQINLNSSRRSSDSSSDWNYRCEIGKIHTSSQLISKLEVQYKVKLVQAPKSPKKRSVILEPDESIGNQTYIKNKDNQNIREQTVTYVHMLIKPKRQMRVLSVIWNNKNIETDEVNQDDVEDFCYRNGWDLVLKKHGIQKKGSPKKPTSGSEKFELIIKAKGHYEQTIKLSEEHKIFTSEEHLFIIDPEEQTIAGIYNREYFQIEECQSIPRSISYLNTLLMLQRPDYKHLKFVFNVFDDKLSEFKSWPLMVPIYQFEDLADDEMYLKKNVRKIFAANGLVHPHFKEKVSELVRGALEKSQPSSSGSVKHSQEREMMMRREESEISEDVKLQKGSVLAKQFLERFIFKDAHLLYQVIYELCNYGCNVLFEEKALQSETVRKYSEAVIKSRGEEGSRERSLGRGSQQSSIGKESSEECLDEDLLENDYRCNFDAWNGYFEQIVYESVELLLSLTEIQNQVPQRQFKSAIYEEQTHIDKVLAQIDHVKEKLILLSNVYKRFNSLIENSLSSSGNGLNSRLKAYQQTIIANLNKIHSIFLVCNLFKVGTHQPDRNEPHQAEKRLKTAINKICDTFQSKTKAKIAQFKLLSPQALKNSQKIFSLQQKIKFQPTSLMPHEFFPSARQLPLADQRNRFGLVLDYLLSNLTQFEQTAYFYYMIRKEIDEAVQIQRQENHDPRFHKYNQSSVISAISQNSMASQHYPSVVFPYMSEELLDFLSFLREVEGFGQQNSFKNWENSQQITVVKKLQKLSLQIDFQPFKFYAIQQCSFYKLPHQIIELIDSTSIQPYTTQSAHFNAQQARSKQVQKISRNFWQQQTLMIKFLISSTVDSIGFENSASQRQVLFYLAKRIISIGDVLMNRANQQTDYFNLYQQYSRQIEQPEKQNTGNKDKPQRPQPQVQFKHYLFAYLIEAFLFFSGKQSLRHLEQVKIDCLTSEEDRTFFQTVIDRNLAVDSKSDRNLPMTSKNNH